MKNTSVNQQSNFSIIKTYAGFWWRFLALIIDGIILSIIEGIFIFPLLGFYGLSLSQMADYEEMDEEQLPYIIAMAGFTLKKQALHDMMAGCLVVKEEKVLKG